MNSKTPSLAMTINLSCFDTFNTSCSGSAYTPTLSPIESPRLLQHMPGYGERETCSARGTTRLTPFDGFPSSSFCEDLSRRCELSISGFKQMLLLHTRTPLERPRRPPVRDDLSRAVPFFIFALTLQHCRTVEPAASSTRTTVAACVQNHRLMFWTLQPVSTRAVFKVNTWLSSEAPFWSHFADRLHTA